LPIIIARLNIFVYVLGLFGGRSVNSKPLLSLEVYHMCGFTLLKKSGCCILRVEIENEKN